jgi:2-polyprenyl-3-methyl-5-hydroxy-6-metoxy-1,4-benzoquinol methylase
MPPAAPVSTPWCTTTARSVLDIGCGAGRLGEALKAQQVIPVVGLEMPEKLLNISRDPPMI